ncbi:MAG TPA: hypothetical protein VN700_16265 [Vicinamibacterales bacterium]|nr:hypothetical protein [Vicinamibacterales bacterium]
MPFHDRQTNSRRRLLMQVIKLAAFVAACVSGHLMLSPVLGWHGLPGWRGPAGCLLVALFLWKTHELAERLIGRRRSVRGPSAGS